MTTDEQIELIRVVKMLASKQGWGSLSRKLEAIGERLEKDRTDPAPIFQICEGCGGPSYCIESKRCHYGRR